MSEVEMLKVNQQCTEIPWPSDKANEIIFSYSEKLKSDIFYCVWK